MDKESINVISAKGLLEGHVGNKFAQNQARIQAVVTDRPKFPPPQPKKEKLVEISATVKLNEEFQNRAQKTEDNKNKTANKPIGKNFITTTKADDLEDYWDDEDTLSKKIDVLVDLIKHSKVMIIYTGAGISTSASIPDYRSKTGVWTMKEKGIEVKTEVELDQALPTLAHNAVVELVAKGYCKLVASTNVDGLHLRSGLLKDNLCELHGNCYLEYCNTCGEQYLRYFSTINGLQDGSRAGHLTGRDCEKELCPGKLHDTIVHFGEALPLIPYQKACELGLKMDLALVVGSSMRVSPSCNMPRQAVTNGGKLVVINLQKTPFEDNVWLHIHASIDHTFKTLMDRAVQ